MLGGFPLAAQTPLDATITYQGQLKQNGSPANGDFDMEFRLYSDLNDGWHGQAPCLPMQTPRKNTGKRGACPCHPRPLLN